MATPRISFAPPEVNPEDLVFRDPPPAQPARLGDKRPRAQPESGSAPKRAHLESGGAPERARSESVPPKDKTWQDPRIIAASQRTCVAIRCPGGGFRVVIDHKRKAGWNEKFEAVYRPSYVRAVNTNILFHYTSPLGLAQFRFDPMNHTLNGVSLLKHEMDVVREAIKETKEAALCAV